MSDDEEARAEADDIDRIDAEVTARLGPAELRVRRDAVLLCIEVQAYLQQVAEGGG